jgi:sulfur carrier protein
MNEIALKGESGVIEILLNGESRMIAANLSVAELLQQLACQGRFVVAMNGALLPRADYVSTALRSDDRVDILTPIAGG